MTTQISIIIGPPGTGKTTTLSTWVSRAAARYGPEKVIVASLTRTAAYQAARNIELPFGQFGTVHAFAYRALGQPVIAEAHLPEWNEAYPSFALSGHGQPRTPDDGYVMPEETTSADGSKLEYARLRTMGIPQTSPLWHRAALGGFTSRWEDWKAQNHFVDFTDMLEQALREVDTAPGEPAVIIGDEWQDVGTLEMQLVNKWALGAEHLVLAGDGAQAIFGWRGTNALLLQELREKHDPDRKTLPKSYRLPRAVLEYANTWQRRFKTTLQTTYTPRTEPVQDGLVVEGSVRKSGVPFSQYTPQSVAKFLKPYLDGGKSVMFEATCGYMLEPVLRALREAGIPYHNPWRVQSGKWNPLPQKRSRGYTIVDRVLAFSRPCAHLWGEGARFWSAGEVKAWVAGLPSTGILARGGQAAVQALPDDASDEQVAASFATWFLPEALTRIVPAPDVEWYLGQVKGSDNLRDFVKQVVRQSGMGKLAEKPQVITGTVHSLKGSEADVVVVSPDLSLLAYEESMKNSESAEEMKRVMYVAITRARESLVLAEASTRIAVKW